jgi:hypothetical protein
MARGRSSSELSPEVAELIDLTREAMMAGIAAPCRAPHRGHLGGGRGGRRAGRAGRHPQFVGHGIGTSMHEEPKRPTSDRPAGRARGRAMPGDRADVHARQPRHPDRSRRLTVVADGSMAAHFEHST